MHLDDIRNALKHCYSRQAESGPESSFRFSQFIGPKRQRLFALYPDPSPLVPSNSNKNRRKKKDKGKQREDPLEGLFQIDELVEGPIGDQGNVNQQSTNPTAAGPSNPTQNMSERPTAAGSHENDLVRIDMGQMLQLREMGHEVVGPINGPNEGQPEYEVRQAVLRMLTSNSRIANALIPSEAEMDPDPDPIFIDPALLGEVDHGDHNNAVSPVANVETLEFTSLHRQPSPNVIFNLLPSTSMARPTTPKRTEPDPASYRTRSQVHLGKRAQANLSPQTGRQTRNSRKKKKVTDDDLAAMEAEKMVQAGSKRKRKATGRK
jgi:hypothetical protein